MQEFSSVTASAYDADALTPLLSEKAAEGWEEEPLDSMFELVGGIWQI